MDFSLLWLLFARILDCLLVKCTCIATAARYLDAWSALLLAPLKHESFRHVLNTLWLLNANRKYSSHSHCPYQVSFAAFDYLISFYCTPVPKAGVMNFEVTSFEAAQPSGECVATTCEWPSIYQSRTPQLCTPWSQSGCGSGDITIVVVLKRKPRFWVFLAVDNKLLGANHRAREGLGCSIFTFSKLRSRHSFAWLSKVVLLSCSYSRSSTSTHSPNFTHSSATVPCCKRAHLAHTTVLCFWTRWLS